MGLFYVFFQMGHIVEGEKGLADFSRAGWASQAAAGSARPDVDGVGRGGTALGSGKWDWDRSGSFPRAQTGEWAACPDLPSLTIPTARHF